MAFGPSPGPPAPTRLIDELLDLLRAAGHTGFRDARGPMGFTQRQAAGRFTREEAEAFIAELQEQQTRREFSDAPPLTPADASSPADEAIRLMPDEQLAAELQRRGWIVVEP